MVSTLLTREKKQSVQTFRLRETAVALSPSVARPLTRYTLFLKGAVLLLLLLLEDDQILLKLYVVIPHLDVVTLSTKLRYSSEIFGERTLMKTSKHTGGRRQRCN